MKVIEAIEERLRKRPHARYVVEGNTLCVLPTSENGFTVGLTVHGNAYTVFFNGWHEEFADQGDALNCFAFGLSRECRLKEWRRGDYAHKWTVEYRQGEEWVEDSTVGLLVFPFWRSAQVVFLQNDLIPMH